MPGMDDAPRLADILAARALLADHLPATPLWSYPVLNAALGATVYVKHENVQPTGAFKVRGGLTLLAGMDPARRARGLVTYSTGNHAQSIAYACARFDTDCTIVMPATTAETKVRALKALGAQTVLSGQDMPAAQTRAEQIAADSGQLLVSPGDTAALIAGVGTTYLEILDAVPDLDLIVVPVGSGTGAAGATLVAEALAPRCRVIGVQSAAAPAAHDSWRAGRLVRRPIRTSAAGLATGRGFELPQRVLRGRLADFHLVSDAQITEAQRLLASDAHTLAEGAGAASLAALLARPAEFAGRRVGVVCTGGNATPSEIASLAGDVAKAA